MKKNIEKIIEEKDIMLDLTPALIFYKDKQNRFLQVNKTYADAMNMSKKELEDKSLFDLYPQKEAEAFWKDDKEVISSGKAKINIIEPLTINGKTRWYQTDKIPYRNKQGKIVGIIGFALDITEKRKTEMKLRESENKYKELVENANSFIFKLDTNGKIIYCNEFAEKFFGFTKKEMYGKDPTETISPKIESSGKDLSEVFRKLYADPDKFPININENIKKNGERVWIAWSNKAMFDKAGKRKGHMAIGTDITSRIKTEEALNVSEIRYRRLFETAHDGILILNSQTGQITDVNPYLEKLLGYSKSEILNKKLWEVGAFKNMSAAKDAFKILQKDGYVRYEDLPLETKDGSLVDVEFVSNTYIADGILVIQCNIRDITERKKISQIKDMKRLLEDEKVKVESVADISHELRTPLAIIKGNVDLALRGGNKNIKSPKSALRAIDYEVKHLSRVLTDLSLITSKAWELKNRIIYDDVNLKSLIEESVARCKSLAYKKNISITYRSIPNVTILGDRGYLGKMLINLVKNSIIYGIVNGHTQITAEELDGFITINVKDDGIGISEEDLPHVFERFYRSDKFHSIGNSIGLGLAIVKWVAEVHGGTVSTKSIKNKGTVFSVSLPIKKK
jgi:PAS domain S-box-containing protein